jgi:hypothetical protein
MATFLLDSVIASRGFTADAVILGAGRWQHSRLHDHFGSDSDQYIVLSQSIGPYPAYTPIKYVLSDLFDRLSQLESSGRQFGDFTIDAIVDTSFTFTVDAHLFGTIVQSGSFTVDATYGQGLSFSIDAYIATTFTVDAFLL